MEERSAYFERKYPDRDVELPPRPEARPNPTPTEETAAPVKPDENISCIDEDELHKRVIEWTEKRFMELLDKHGIMVEDKKEDMKL